ncbi:MAG: hypothetical protein QM723_17635 [Myxococcaceae bacterium]
MRILLVLPLLVCACSDGPSLAPCSSLGWNDCLNRTDCVTDQCPNCSGVDLNFLDCHDKGTAAKSCPVLQCGPQSCDDGNTCGAFQVCGEREASFSGTCSCGSTSCANDGECDGGTVCDDTPCHCGRVCVAPCQVASCPQGTFCSANGHCQASACAGGAGCPAGFDCDAGACERPSCSATQACADGGFCVHGSCFPAAGVCVPNQ